MGHGHSPLTERPIDRCSNCKGAPLRTFYTWVEVLNSRSSCLGLSQVLGSLCYSFPSYLKGKQLLRFHLSSPPSTYSAGIQSSLCTGQTSYSVLALQPFLLMLLVVVTTQFCFEFGFSSPELCRQAGVKLRDHLSLLPKY